MSNRSILSLQLPDYLIKKLKESSIFTIKDLITKYPMDLVKLLSISLPKAEQILKKAMALTPLVPITAFDMLDISNSNNNNCNNFLEYNQFDRVIYHNGLIQSGMVTEVCGPPGVGKTQFLIQLCSTHFLHSNDKTTSIIYIDTENNFNSKRLLEVSKANFENHSKSEEYLIKMLKNVFLVKACSLTEFMNSIDTIEQEILIKNTGMVIIDSLATIVRREFSGTDSSVLYDRSIFLANISNRFKDIAQQLDISIIVTNQILTVSMLDKSKSNGEENSIVPALGSSWSHFINIRLILQFVDDRTRELMVAKSPLCSFKRFRFEIKSEDGIIFDDASFEYSGVNPSHQKIKIKPYTSLRNV